MYLLDNGIVGALYSVKNGIESGAVGKRDELEKANRADSPDHGVDGVDQRRTPECLSKAQSHRLWQKKPDTEQRNYIAEKSNQRH